MLIREILGWFLAVETALAVIAIFTDDWWGWFKIFNLSAGISALCTGWVYLIQWLITGSL